MLESDVERRIDIGVNGRHRLALIGHSHMISIKAAAEKYDLGRVIVSVTAIAAYEPIMDPMPDTLIRLLDSATANATAVCLQIKGNQHTVYGLLKQMPELDVVTSTEPELALVPGAQIVPEAAFYDFFERSLCGLKTILKHFQTTVSVPVLVLGPPPPIADAGFVALHLDRYFVNRLGEMAVPVTSDAIAPALVRWKIWRTLIRAYETIAREYGGVWLDTPREALDNRYLHRRAWGSDATHANEWYGELRLRQIEEVIA